MTLNSTIPSPLTFYSASATPALPRGDSGDPETGHPGLRHSAPPHPEGRVCGSPPRASGPGLKVSGWLRPGCRTAEDKVPVENLGSKDRDRRRAEVLKVGSSWGRLGVGGRRRTPRLPLRDRAQGRKNSRAVSVESEPERAAPSPCLQKPGSLDRSWPVAQLGFGCDCSQGLCLVVSNKPQMLRLLQGLLSVVL